MSRDVTEIYDVVPVFAVDETGKALITEEQYSWLCNYAVRKAELVRELEVYVDINYKKHVNLNEFLQKRYLPKYLGLHVVDAVIDYVETLENGSESYQNMIKIARKTIDELEHQNKRYCEVIENIKRRIHLKYETALELSVGIADEIENLYKDLEESE